MTNYKGHETHKDSILGRYCWVCRIRVAVGIPGWPMGHQGGFTRYSPWIRDSEGNGHTESIVWASGESQRTKDQTQCVVCDKHCSNPVQRGLHNRGDKYKEIKVSEIKEC